MIKKKLMLKLKKVYCLLGIILIPYLILKQNDKHSHIPMYQFFLIVSIKHCKDLLIPASLNQSFL